MTVTNPKRKQDKMSAPGSPSLLARLRGTPGSLRRKFRKAHSLNLTNAQPDTPPTTPVTEHTFRFNQSLRKHDENRNRTSPFTCRFLGMMSIYTLHPEHCYGFAEELAKAANEGEGKEVNNNGPTTKRQIVVKEHSLEISPVEKRQKRKSAGVGSPTLRQKPLSGSTATLNTHKGVSNRTRTVSCEELISDDYKRESPTTVFPNCRDSGQISVFSPPPYTERGGRAKPAAAHLPERNVFTLGRSINAMPDHSQEDLFTTIALHDVAYCVTVPSNPRLFLVTSRQGSCLVCRVFLFNRREKSQELTLVLANQFKKSYLEWQSGKNNRRKASVGKERRTQNGDEANAVNKEIRTKMSLRSHSAGEAENAAQESDANKDSGHEGDVYSSQDELEEVISNEKTAELAKAREFERRASCMEQPENLLAGGMTVERLEQYCQNILITSDESTTDEERESDESDDKLHPLIS